MQQLTDNLILVDPSGFHYTSKMRGNGISLCPAKFISQEQIMRQFEQLLETLDQFKIKYQVYTSLPTTPSGIFPNNWITFHWECDPPAIVVYPMNAKHRRRERGLLVDILTDIMKQSHVNLSLVNNVIDLTQYEQFGHYLEGTGSLVLDRQNKIAYACFSCRTHREVLDVWANRLKYQLCLFNAMDRHGEPIYHTNIMMSVGQQYVIVCMESIRDKREQQMLTNVIKQSGKISIPISLFQMGKFCGNCLQVINQDGLPVLCLSRSAYDNFTSKQLQLLKNFSLGGLAVIDFSLIEQQSGGSVRCSLLEKFPTKFEV
jgi:hypothetical protein